MVSFLFALLPLCVPYCFGKMCSDCAIRTLFVITNVVAIKELRDSKNITRAKEEINSEPDMHQAA